LELDEEEELCKAYIVCESNKRPSLQLMGEKNHERMKRLKDKHSQALNSMFSSNQGTKNIF
jgi:hypothetical protein